MRLIRQSQFAYFDMLLLISCVFLHNPGQKGPHRQDLVIPSMCPTPGLHRLSSSTKRLEESRSVADVIRSRMICYAEPPALLAKHSGQHRGGWRKKRFKPGRLSSAPPTSNIEQIISQKSSTSVELPQDAS